MAATVDIVIPVYNEEEALPLNVVTLIDFLKDNLPNPWRIIIADSVSTDRTRLLAEELCERFPGVSYLYLPQRGRGLALRKAWLDSTADIVSYMDVDLATDLSHFPQLIHALEEGCHIAIGSRLSRGSKVFGRSLTREVTSRCYNILIRSMFFTAFGDAQCGFKALTRETAHAIVPKIKNNYWFFDTELLIIAAKRGYRIEQIPVTWHDDPGTTVKIARTAIEDMKGLLRLRVGGVPMVALPEKSMPQ